VYKKRLAGMIPVALQPEPEDFDTKVRQPGLAWLAEHGIAPASPLPKASGLPAYWSQSNKQLWTAYSGVCAYLAIFFEWSTGASFTIIRSRIVESLLNLLTLVSHL
jgi:hypothetical protein